MDFTYGNSFYSKGDQGIQLESGIQLEIGIHCALNLIC